MNFFEKISFSDYDRIKSNYDSIPISKFSITDDYLKMLEEVIN